LPDALERGELMPLSPELTRKVLEAAPSILYVYDVQKERSVFQNRRISELLGHLPTTATSPTEWARFIHPDDADRFPQHREQLKTIQAGQTLTWEFRMRDGQGQWRWFLSRDSLLSTDERGNPLLVVGSTADITEQKQAEQHKQLLADEMRHRARNLVSIVQAIGRMSRPKDQPDVNKHIDVFMGRLLTLLNTGGIVLSSDSRTADLETIVKTTLSPFFGEASSRRIAVEGPTVTVPERTAGGLALAIHELATNALKYGALSNESGSVSLHWSIADHEENRRFAMAWKEKGGPRIKAPRSEGFGGMVIRQSVAREQNSKVTLDYQPQGLICQLEFELAKSL
jgi:PAS domain S-box-containing protein